MPEPDKSLNRHDRTRPDHGSPPVMILQPVPWCCRVPPVPLLAPGQVEAVATEGWRFNRRVTHW